MVRLSDLSDDIAAHLLALECPVFESRPWVMGPPLSERRIAIVSTAGLLPPGDQGFVRGEADYRVIPGDIDSRNVMMSHISVNFDRTGFQQDPNVLFPIDRLRDLAADGTIGSVAGFHYSFMGATEPQKMESMARQIAGLLKQDAVDAVLLVPV